jgi:hypothetical protein
MTHEGVLALLTSKLDEEESFLRSWYFNHISRNPQQYVEPKDSLQRSKQSNTNIYTEVNPIQSTLSKLIALRSIFGAFAKRIVNTGFYAHQSVNRESIFKNVPTRWHFLYCVWTALQVYIAFGLHCKYSQTTETILISGLTPDRTRQKWIFPDL